MNQERQNLILAQNKAIELFNAAEEGGLIVSGKSERELSEEIVKLASEQFGIKEYWHKKIVRTGVNTIHPFNVDPPNLTIQDGDILFFDFGPIFNGWEADLGRTFVLGNDPIKLKLKRDVETAWQEAKTWILSQSSITGAEYFYYVTCLAKRYGWEFGGEIAGHIVGRFPHEQAGPGNWSLDVHPDNHEDILLSDKRGIRRSWILEIQFVDKIKNIGGFYEQLLN